jgi:hypothetical protein
LANTVINLFNDQGGGNVVSLGGFDSNGDAKIPLTLISSGEFRFAVPAGAVTGPAFVQAINPPFIPSSSSDDDPDGAFTLVAP